jgi:ferrochelatase
MLRLSSQSSPEKPGSSVGILLINVGSPSDPTPNAVKRYLAEFLADRRIVDWPRWLWLPILHAIILRVRPHRSARLYQEIWTSAGSPLLRISQSQADALEKKLNAKSDLGIFVEPAMRYGEPSIQTVLEKFEACSISRILTIPLYPQYSTTTTASALDALNQALQQLGYNPELRVLDAYYDEPGYVRALYASIQDHWKQDGEPQHLLFSYHGIPLRYAKNGDPYPEQCQQTTEKVVQALGLPADRWAMSYQSKFGPEEWLSPSTEEILRSWGENQCAHVDVLAPGFATDCLETLHEIQIELNEAFEECGGGQLDYIPALNDQEAHIDFLVTLTQRELEAWLHT